MSDSRLDAAHGNPVNSFHQAFDPVREPLEEEKCESRVCSYRSPYGGLRKKQASGWFGGDRCRGITTAGEERNFSECGSGITRMNDQLAASTAADDTDASLEDERNAFGAIPSRPENLARRELPLYGLLEQRVSARGVQALE
jgi:hypothetical protein